MRDFDIESIGKKMPYSAPSEEFFERVTIDTLKRAKREQIARRTLRRLTIGLTTIAAAVVVAVVYIIPSTRPTYEVELSQLESNLDTFFETLSNDEVSAIAELSDNVIMYN